MLFYAIYKLLVLVIQIGDRKKTMPTVQKERVRIAACAGYSGDRIDPAAYVLKHGNVDYGVFECLAERTIALAVQRLREDPQSGYDPLLRQRMEAVLPICKRKGIKLITNMGAANPLEAARVVRTVANACNAGNLVVKVVVGDNVIGNISRYMDAPLMEDQNPGKPEQRVNGLSGVISANAYLGAEGIIKALDKGADVVITGRVADPSLFLAPLMFELGWRSDDYPMLGKGLVAGHLLECGAQVSGGYFDDGSSRKHVPDLWNTGFPIAEVGADGKIVITKAKGTGGMITRETCTEQLLYEIHDPETYITPDAVADFSHVNLTELAPNQISVTGATAKERTDTLKVSIGYIDCFIGEGEISYSGTNAIERALLAKDIVTRRLKKLNVPIVEGPRAEINGTDAAELHKNPLLLSSIDRLLRGARLRISARTKTADAARRIGEEIESLYTNGPAGGGGARKSVEETVSIASILIPRSDVKIEVE